MAPGKPKPRNSDAELKFLLAVKSGKKNLVEEILSSDPKMVNCVDLLGCHSTALHLAAAYDRVAVVECLLKNGADVDALDRGQQASLHRACYLNHFEVAKMLIEHGATVNISDSWNSTPLHEATGAGNIKIVELLLEHGADVGKRDTKDCIPRDLVKEGNERIARLLEQNSAIMKSVQNGNLRSVVALITAENFKYMDLQNCTLLHQAAARGHVELAEYLLMIGADINSKNLNQLTPLHLANSNGHSEMTALLLKYGSFIDEVDKDKSMLSHGKGSSLKKIEEASSRLASDDDVSILRDTPTTHENSTSLLEHGNITSILKSEDIAMYDIRRFLGGLDLGHLLDLFIREKITMDILSGMSHDDLLEKGIEDQETRDNLLKGIHEWGSREGTVVRNLPLENPEYEHINEIINKCLLSREYEIIKIQKLDNKKLRKSYTRKLHQLEKANNGDSNEKVLFNVPTFLTKSIIEKGFDEKLTGYFGGSGAGIYFVDQPFIEEKKCFKHNDSSCYICPRNLFLSRVCLGKSHVHSNRIFVANPPPKHHSVIGEPKPGGFKVKQYVVFRGEQAYPEYYITYKKMRPKSLPRDGMSRLHKSMNLMTIK